MFYPKNISGVVRPWEQLPAAAGTYVAGQLVATNDGKVVPLNIAVTKTPGYLCVADVTLTEGELLPVTRISKDEVYVTQLSVATEGAVVGARLQVSAGGLQVDGAEAGAFEVVYADGTAAGSEVHGRFN